MASSLNDPTTPPASRTSGVPSDQWAKRILLAASTVTVLFLLGAAVRENLLSPWRYFQRKYRNQLVAAEDERLRKAGASFAVEIRQVDLPHLGTTDRCVSCHVAIDNPLMADNAQPLRVHSGDYLKHHPVERYGCTICHQGQGAAMNFHEAKATDVYWDFPLLPAHLTQASCGICHAADSPLMARHAPKLTLGRQLFVDRGCQSCHKVGGVGGQLGPALDGEGRKIKHQLPMGHVKGEHTLANWLEQHFDNPQAIVPNSQMRPPRLTRAENEALTVYMLSLQNRDLPQTYVPGDRITARDRELHHKVTDPALLFNQFCVNCHGDGTFGSWDRFFNRFTPAVRGPGLRALADREYLKTAIEKGRPGTPMSGWSKNAGGLTDQQISKLADFLLAGDDRPPQALKPAPKPGTGDAGRGGELFAQLCAGCHGGSRLAPSLGNPVFLRQASDAFLARTISNGRTDTAMPTFQGEGSIGLTDAEVHDLVAYIRSLSR